MSTIAERLENARRRPRVAVIRRALGLAQASFAERYGISLGTIRGSEQALLSRIRRLGRICGRLRDMLICGFCGGSGGFGLSRGRRLGGG